MKTVKRSLIISLVPIVTTLTAFAQTGTPAGQASTTNETKGNAPAWRASQVIGTDVKNSASESIGEVEDLVINMKDGEILAVVISSGGFLGIGNSLSAVPLQVLRYDVNDKAFKTKLTKEQLGEAPQFKSDAWPDYSDASSTEALRSFRASIDGDVTGTDNSSRNVTGTDYTRNTAGTHSNTRNTTGTDNNARKVTDADNTAHNKKAENRDYNPTDQGNSSRDVQITKDIRSGIMDADLSFNAKNIKIITSNERVTLKGVVESHDEHEKILKIARNHASTAQITDELKVNSK
jgi:sporulation protein YlmC with PRC-barrel domain